MRCPACATTLTEIQVPPIKVDVCEGGCGGIFFDNFELSRVDEAHETLGGGFLVRLDCKHDPHRIWVATREVDGHLSVVGLTTLLPRFIGGEPPERDDVADRLTSRSLGLANAQNTIVSGDVHPWLPFPIEEF